MTSNTHQHLPAATPNNNTSSQDHPTMHTETNTVTQTPFIIVDNSGHIITHSCRLTPQHRPPNTLMGSKELYWEINHLGEYDKKLQRPPSKGGRVCVDAYYSGQNFQWARQHAERYTILSTSSMGWMIISGSKEAVKPNCVMVYTST